MNSNIIFTKDQNRPKFVVDFMLGRLAKWLRILGYDTVYADKHLDESLLLTSLKEGRILVTRSKTVSKKRALKLVFIVSGSFIEQVRQLARELNLKINEEYFFTLCTFCNAPLLPVEKKDSLKTFVPDYVFQTQNKFSRCPTCGKVYWPGTHYGLLLKTLKESGLTK